jgi:UDP:flavonoid glycosyltransferase YjiC (YdhE family)
MERTELMAGERANRLRAVRVSRHGLNGEIRRVHDDRMLWKGTALMRLAPIPIINSILSNAAELRLQSLQVVGVRMENRPPMKGVTGRLSSRIRTNGAISLRVVRLARQRPGGRQSQISRTVLQLNFNDAG